MSKVALTNRVSRDVNHLYLEGTIALRDQLEEGFIVLAERLKKIRDAELFQSEYDSFEDFVAELRISRSTAYKIISVYEKFVLLGEIDASKVAKAGWGSLCLFTGHVSSKTEAREVFDRISGLSRSDASKELVELKTGVPQMSCEHGDFYDMRVCRKCGLKMKVYPSGNEAI